MAEREVQATVVDRQLVAEGVVVLGLRPDDAATDLTWEPGAHIDLVLDNGVVRQYSLCGDLHDAGRWQVAIRREDAGRGGSAWVHDELTVGAAVVVRGPRNAFPLRVAERYLFIAGGIGITPLKPMIEAADKAGASWRLVYGGRSAASMPFADELRSTYGDRVDLRPEDVHGLLDLAAVVTQEPRGSLVYCCGPNGMLDAIAAIAASWPPARLNIERFTPIAPTRAADDVSFEVELASTGEVLTVPADRSILDVLDEAGVPVLSSCSEGTCRTCETQVLAGEIDHRDSCLSPVEREAGDYMLICVSRARGERLVLDL